MELCERLACREGFEGEAALDEAMESYISLVNHLVTLWAGGMDLSRLTTALVDWPLPSALVNQAIRDARSVAKSHTTHVRDWRKREARLAKRRAAAERENEARRARGLPEKRLPKAPRPPRVPVLKRPVYMVNNQNWSLVERGRRAFASVPVPDGEGGSRRMEVPVELTARQREALERSPRLGTLRLVRKAGRLTAFVAHGEPAPLGPVGDGTEAGCDLNLKCPAVVATSDGKVRFFGNGRRNRHIRRKSQARRRDLQRHGKRRQVKRERDREARRMRDADHKASREVTDFLVSQNVTALNLEALKRVQSTARRSRKNNRALCSWPFGRLMDMIEYKCARAGILVRHVAPAHTSQTCPACGRRNKAHDRDYSCPCGLHAHRDAVAARNILASTAWRGR